MDYTSRHMVKIVRELSKFTVRSMKESGIGPAEFDFVHLLRHHPGLTQAQVREELRIDKGAAARRASSLETKGYIVRRENPADKRSRLLYATEKAEGLRNSKAEIEALFFEWLLEDLPEERRDDFCRTLDELYWKSKRESRTGFPHVSLRIKGESHEED